MFTICNKSFSLFPISLQILKEGEGEEGPLQGDRVSVHYIGILAEDGSKFDSSRESGERFEFTLGKGRNSACIVFCL